jgi:hypothetical protein
MLPAELQTVQVSAAKPSPQNDLGIRMPLAKVTSSIGADLAAVSDHFSYWIVVRPSPLPV